MRLAPLLASLLLVLPAGCVGQAAPVETATGGPHARAADAPAVEPPEAERTAPPPHAAESVPPARNETIRLEDSGTTEGEICPGLLRRVERCLVPTGAEGSPVELPVVERATLLRITIGVDEPLQAPGCAWAVLRVKEGDSWVSQGDAGKIALGGSPLAATWSLAEYPPHSRFHVAIYCGSDAHVADGAVTLYTGWAAPFRLEGDLFHETRADAA